MFCYWVSLETVKIGVCCQQQMGEENELPGEYKLECNASSACLPSSFTSLIEQLMNGNSNRRRNKHVANDDSVACWLYK